MDDLLKWLDTQLADDERVAALASPEIAPDDPLTSNEDREHIVRWRPARVLTLVRTLRELVDDFHWEGRETYAVMALAEALYSERPGYRDEWRP